jgi:hypothetical protein
VADAIKTALQEAKAKLDQLLAERRKIDDQILDWKRVIDSLCAVSEDVSDTLPPDIEFIVAAQAALPGSDNLKAESSPTRLTFTEAIRTILRLRDFKVVPVPEIRDELMECGFDFSKYKQKLVPVHNALKRLEEQGEVRAAKNDQGRVKGYQWIAPIERAFLEEHNWLHTGGLSDHMQTAATEALRKLVRENPDYRERLREQAHKNAERKYEEASKAKG